MSAEWTSGQAKTGHTGLEVDNAKFAPEVEQPGLEAGAPSPPYGMMEAASAPGPMEKHIANYSDEAMNDYSSSPAEGGKAAVRTWPFAFWAATALMLVTIIALAGGLGGVAGSRGHQISLLQAAVSSCTHTSTSTVTVQPSSTNTASPTYTTSALPAAATPASDCTSRANFTVAQTCNTYQYFCNTNNGNASQNRFNGYQPNFEACVSMCDSYNFWTGTVNITAVVYNLVGADSQVAGNCWCKVYDGSHASTTFSGVDTAVLVANGTSGIC